MWLIILPYILKFWSFAKKYAVYILLVSSLLLSVISFSNYRFNAGYKKGYAACAKDRPTYGSVGTVNNLGETDLKAFGIIFKLWFIRLKLGI